MDDGEADGIWLGEEEGTPEGAGEVLGSVDGMSEGLDEGAWLGKDEGSDEGMLLGIPLGAAVSQSSTQTHFCSLTFMTPMRSNMVLSAGTGSRTVMFQSELSSVGSSVSPFLNLTTLMG